MAQFNSGLMNMAIIYFMGTASGADFNPGGTLAFAVRRDFPWSRVLGYICAQCLGGARRYRNNGKPQDSYQRLRERSNIGASRLWEKSRETIRLG